ncbi:MAG: hypothetical protein PWP24_118 [Clostridiales bacterium]|nr:hypothetical protein [Clostridiales bacterium]
MLAQLKKQLIRIYSCTTGVIVTLVVILTFFVSRNQDQMARLESFQNNFSTVSGKLKTENVISNEWVASLEDKNHIILLMSENGVPLQLMRANEIEKRRAALFLRLEELSKKDGVDTALPPVSVEEKQSRVYRFEQGYSEFYGQVLAFSTQNGYRSLMLIQEFPGARAEKYGKLIVFFFIDLFGILLLYATSVWFVGRAMKPVEEGKRSQDDFVAAASHELRSPLSVILANLSLLKSERANKLDILACLERETKRMSRLIEDLLLLSYTDAGKWKLEMETVEVENLLIEVYEAYLLVCKQKTVKLNIDLGEEELGIIKGDKYRLKQILSILIENALRFSPEEGEITLRGIRQNTKKSKIMIEVEDHGCGILENDKERVFERFYQVDAARSDKEHFGLGLSIAKQLTELLGGEIGCKDTPFKGATFFLLF